MIAFVAAVAAATPLSPRPQEVFVNLAGDHGGFVVNVQSYGRPYAFDPSKLRLTIVRRDAAADNPKPLDVTFGAPVRLPQDPGVPALDRLRPPPTGAWIRYRMPLQVHAPERPGLYIVRMSPADGFATTMDGAAISVFHGGDVTDVYWPDESGNDAGLARVRDALQGRSVHGYGGITIACGEATFQIYLPDAAARVRRVARRHGVIERLWTGLMPSRGNDKTYSFLAVDPIGVWVDSPPTKPFATGGSSQPAGDGPCPGFDVADPWHMDVSVTTAEPPPLPSGYAVWTTAIGMTREEVAWRRGFPPGFRTREELMRADEWDYANAPPDSWSVTFKNGRVASFTNAHGLP